MRGDPTLLKLGTGATVAVTDQGEGSVILLLHGVCMSSVFFERNIDELALHHRVISMDFRGHGRSPSIEGGHTVAHYAQDVHALLVSLGVKSATGIGWSMGALVLWDYLLQYSSDLRITSVVVISQGPSDFIQEDWNYGIADTKGLHAFHQEIQSDLTGFLSDFLSHMFAADLAEFDHSRLLNSITSIGANAGSCILVDQTLVDYRDQISSFSVPHLLVWGTDEKVIAQASGTWLKEHLPNSELQVFIASGHCPMWEEADAFNELVRDWIARL
jgi:non-heme chloroperoxidase